MQCKVSHSGAVRIKLAMLAAEFYVQNVYDYYEEEYEMVPHDHSKE